MSSGRLQIVAASLVAASALAAAPLAAADEPDGAMAFATGTREKAPTPGESLLRFSQANALAKWNLTASASRKPWDPTQPLSLISRTEPFDAVAGDASRASLAFEWQRKLASGRIEAAAFASRRDVSLFSDLSRFDGPAQDERYEQREQRSLFGAAVRWSGSERLGGLPSATSVSARVRSESIDAEGVMRAHGARAFDALREDRLRQSSAGFTLQNETLLVHGLKSVASLRYDGYRFGMASDLAGHGGHGSGGLVSPHLSLIAAPGKATEVFLTTGRGYRSDDPRAPGAVLDPRSGAPLGVLDPLATLATTEVGVRGQWLPKVTTSVSMFRSTAQSELAFTGDTGVAEFARPTVRQGVQASLRYAPTPWLALDIRAAVLRARFGDGVHEYIPGAAERNASAGATLKVLNGWNASLFVSYFGARAPVDDDGARLKSTTSVNARLSRNLTKTTRVTFDIFNVFDQRGGDIDYFSTTRVWSQPGAGDSFLFNPAEPRGFRIKLRATF